MGNLDLSDPLSLPCGATLKNRLAKSAMSENLGSADLHATPELATLYQRWAAGGAGLLISGNVMCDRSALGEPHNVAIQKNHTDLEKLKIWAAAGTQNNTHFWMQINHPGRQSPQFLSETPVAPSAISLKPPLDRMFNQPRALSETEIREIIRRFADTAEIATQVGFTGVQIHGAHGYLVAQFLSPLSNQRTDQWGGPIENRMRFVMEVYRAIRKRVGSHFPVGIKLNSADFQRGGFSEEDSLLVVEGLSREGIDLLEISGGSYESQVMMTGNLKTSTRAREAYFLDFATRVRKSSTIPLMVTGGFRSAKAMRQALTDGDLDLVGLARSMALDPDFPGKLLKDDGTVSLVKPLTSGIQWVDRLVPLEIIWYTDQLHRMGKGRAPKPNAWVAETILRSIATVGWQALKRVRG